MLASSLLAASLFCASGTVAVLAVMLYRDDRHRPQLRWFPLLLVSLAAVSLACAAVVWLQYSVTTTGREAAVPVSVHWRTDR